MSPSFAITALHSNSYLLPFLTLVFASSACFLFKRDAEFGGNVRGWLLWELLVSVGGVGGLLSQEERCSLCGCRTSAAVVSKCELPLLVVMSFVRVIAFTFAMLCCLAIDRKL